MADARIKRYVLRETAIAALFNMAFSVGFAWFFFRNLAQVPQMTLIIDAIPQSFAVTFFGVLIPTLITRAKIRSGKLAALQYRPSRLPANPALRAITMGILAAVGGGLLHLLVFRGLQIEAMSVNTTLLYKPIYAALLTLFVTPIALRIALSAQQGENE